MKLAELQREMAGAIMAAPGGRTVRTRRAVEAIIKRNGRLSSLERLEIYRESYWARVLSSFTEDYPGVRGILGPGAFARIAKRYLTDCPSQSFTLRDLGWQFEGWLSAHPELAGAMAALVVDMARLEWAHIEAFDGQSGKPLSAEDLLTPGAGMRFKIQPHIRLLALAYPVDDLRIHLVEMAEETRRRQAAAVRKCAAGGENGQIFLAVYRREFSVYYRRLSTDEFRLLHALRGGTTLAEAIAPFEHAAELVGSWFACWAQMGWLMPAVSAIRIEGEL